MRVRDSQIWFAYSPLRQVSRGANVFARADFGATILHAAATTGNVEGIQFALQNGVNVNVKGIDER